MLRNRAKTNRHVSKASPLIIVIPHKIKLFAFKYLANLNILWDVGADLSREWMRALRCERERIGHNP